MVASTIYDQTPVAPSPVLASHRGPELAAVFISQWTQPGREAIEPHSGQLLLDTTDIVVPAGTIQLQLSRSLLLEPTAPCLLGTRWRLNWEKRALRNRAVAVVEEGAARTVFRWDAVRKHYRASSGDVIVFDKGTAVRTTPGGFRETFDAYGRLTERNERNGNKIRLQYDAGGRLSRVEGPMGSFLRLVVGTDGRLTHVQGSSGTSVYYSYNAERLAGP